MNDDTVVGYVPEIYKLGNGREVMLKDLAPEYRALLEEAEQEKKRNVQTETLVVAAMREAELGFKKIEGERDAITDEAMRLAKVNIDLVSERDALKEKLRVAEEYIRARDCHCMYEQGEKCLRCEALAAIREKGEK